MCAEWRVLGYDVGLTLGSPRFGREKGEHCRHYYPGLCATREQAQAVVDRMGPRFAERGDTLTVDEVLSRGPTLTMGEMFPPCR